MMARFNKNGESFFFLREIQKQMIAAIKQKTIILKINIATIIPKS